MHSPSSPPPSPPKVKSSPNKNDVGSTRLERVPSYIQQDCDFVFYGPDGVEQSVLEQDSKDFKRNVLMKCECQNSQDQDCGMNRSVNLAHKFDAHQWKMQDYSYFVRYVCHCNAIDYRHFHSSYQSRYWWKKYKSPTLLSSPSSPSSPSSSSTIGQSLKSKKSFKKTKFVSLQSNAVIGKKKMKKKKTSQPLMQRKRGRPKKIVSIVDDPNLIGSTNEMKEEEEPKEMEITDDDHDNDDDDDHPDDHPDHHDDNQEQLVVVPLFNLSAFVSKIFSQCSILSKLFSKN